MSNNNISYDYPLSPNESLLNADPSKSSDEDADLVGMIILISMTVLYLTIFIIGLIGNVSTCIVISRNKSMHTATNYYLFSLAVSDLLLLFAGVPMEIDRMWSPLLYIWGESVCIITSFAAETSAYASVLTITAFTVERYVAICHPFLSHTMSKLSRAIKFVFSIWILACLLAMPEAYQFGIVIKNSTTRCDVIPERNFIPHIFEIATLLMFVLPMTIISGLYLLIGVKLRKSRILTLKNPPVLRQRVSATTQLMNGSESAVRTPTSTNSQRNSSRAAQQAQNRVIKMLVAVVVAFFLCWAPFHAQRVLAMYLTNIHNQQKHGGEKIETPVLNSIYDVLNYTSGVLYYLSTTINPLLYNIMSNKFRDAFKNTFAQLCDHRHSSDRHLSRRPTYSSLNRFQQSSVRHFNRNGVGQSSFRQKAPQTPKAAIQEENPSVHSEPPITRINSVKLLANINGSSKYSESISELNRQYSVSNSSRTSSKEDLTLQVLPKKERYKPVPTNRGLNVKRNGVYYRPRFDSEALSQTTITTVHHTNSQTSLCRPVTTKFGRPLSCVIIKKKSASSITSTSSRSSFRQRKHPKRIGGANMLKTPINFYQIVHRLRTIFHSHNADCEHNHNFTPRHTSNYSVGSTIANTISNSSLQDLDDIEFSSSDLAKYMGELNRNIA